MKTNYVKENIEDLIKEPHFIYEEMLDDFYKRKATDVPFDTVTLAYDLRNYIMKHGKMSGSTLATTFRTTPQAIRQAIQYMRMFYKFDNFIVADSKGYYFTRDKEVIKAFLHKTLTRFKNTHAQINNMLRLLTVDNET